MSEFWQGVITGVLAAYGFSTVLTVVIACFLTPTLEITGGRID